MLRKIKTWVKLHPNWQYSIRVLSTKLYRLSTLFKKQKLAADDTNIVFVVGSGRSGNTILRRMLIENLSIFIPPESYVLGPIVSTTILAKGLNWDNLVDLVLSKFYLSPEFKTFEFNHLDQIANECKKWHKSKQTVGNIIVYFYFSLARDKKITCSWIGDKTPVNTFNLGLIAKMFPKASFIYLERDGIDVVNSYYKAGLYSTIEAAGKRWVESRTAWKNFKASLRKEQYIEIKYEDLTENYRKTIQAIAHHLNIPSRDKQIDVARLLGDVNTLPHHAQVSKAVSSKFIGKGRAELSTEQLQAIAGILNKDLKDAGYEII